jgi:LPS-assembly lipoprotein
MSLYDRRTLLVSAAAIAALAACGFQPVYAPGGVATGLHGKIRTTPPADDLGFDFIVAFEDRLGRPTQPVYELAHRIELSTRGDSLFGTLGYELTEIGTGQVRSSGQVTSFVTAATGPTPLSTDRARDAAESRLARALADQLVARLMAARLE